MLIKDVRREVTGDSDSLASTSIDKDILDLGHNNKNDSISWKGTNKGRKRGEK